MDTEKLIVDAIYNIEQDRRRTSRLLRGIEETISETPHHHKEVGMVAAKYVETLQRSNEQLVKIISVLSKNNKPSDTELTEKDKEKIYEELEEENK